MALLRARFESLFDFAGIIAQRPVARWFDAGWLAAALGENTPSDPMTLVTASDLAKAYRSQPVFRGLSFSIPHQARIHLVAPKGAGKSALLRILAGQEAPTRGRLLRARGLRVALLPQEVGSAPGRRGRRTMTLAAYCAAAFADLLAEEAELARLEAVLPGGRHTAETMARLGPLQESYERKGGPGYAARIEAVLAGLGFCPSDPEKTLGQLSPPERTRAVLARKLLENPDLLLLDDPTPHLGPEAIDWLAGWLGEWPGAALVASRDRYLLDRVADEVWHLSPSGIEVGGAPEDWVYSPGPISVAGPDRPA
jgi:ATP-binding cassette subfamily F protein 3